MAVNKYSTASIGLAASRKITQLSPKFGGILGDIFETQAIGHMTSLAAAKLDTSQNLT